MPVTTDIVATYRGPRPVFRRLFAAGQREDRVLAYLMGFAVLGFVAQLPRLSREAHLKDEDLNMLMGGALMAWVFLLPLLLYAVAALVALIGRIMGRKASGYGVRLALFWSLLASSPVLLFLGLVAGFVGPGLEHNAVGVAWFAVFLWFWISGLREAGAEAK